MHWITGNEYPLCTRVTRYKSAANYLPCKRALMGTNVHIEMIKANERMRLCEVEIYQTKTSE